MKQEERDQLFLMMCNIFYNGEFYHWLNKQTLDMAVLKEYEEARDYFYYITRRKDPERE